MTELLRRNQGFSYLLFQNRKTKYKKRIELIGCLFVKQNGTGWRSHTGWSSCRWRSSGACARTCRAAAAPARAARRTSAACWARCRSCARCPCRGSSASSTSSLRTLCPRHPSSRTCSAPAFLSRQNLFPRTNSRLRMHSPSSLEPTPLNLSVRIFNIFL